MGEEASMRACQLLKFNDETFAQMRLEYGMTDREVTEYYRKSLKTFSPKFASRTAQQFAARCQHSDFVVVPNHLLSAGISLSAWNYSSL